MNKAFVREPEPEDTRCPTPRGCDGFGVPVGRGTVVAQLGEDAAGSLADATYYCPNPSCAVAYFDIYGKTVPASALRTAVYPKSATGPICPCFAVTAAEIREEAEAGRRDRVRKLLEDAESASARCKTESPTGRSCAVEVRRLFVKHFASE